MIQHKSILKVIDNSGAKTAQCIRVLGGYKKKCGTIGDLILVSIKSLKVKVNKIKVEKKSVFKAIIVQTKLIYQRKIGVKTILKNNSIILLDKLNNPLGTRIKGFVPEKLKVKFYKLVSISFNFV